MSWRFGGTRFTAGASGPPAFGPQNGVQWVKNNAVPQVVTDPGGGVSFTTRADLQSKIDANSAGTTFVHAAGGTETWDAQINCGTKAPKIYFLGLAGSTATVIDGGNNDINGFAGAVSGSGFEIHGGTIQGFGNPATVATVTRRGINMVGPGLIEDAVITLCHIGFSIGVGGSGAIVRRVRTHANRRYGCTVSGASGSPVSGLLLEHVRIENNNTSQLNFDDASGTKFVWMKNSTIRYCHADDNHGWGIWPDGFNESLTITENVTEDNWRGGIFYELSHGGSVISRNALYRDCAANTEISTRHTRAALLVSESDGTLGPGGGNLITRNIVDTAAWPITLFDNDNRAMVTKDVDVDLNDFYLRSVTSRAGSDDQKATKTMHSDASITWTRNRYSVLDLATEHWYQPTAVLPSERITWAQWQGKGFDLAGERVVI